MFLIRSAEPRDFSAVFRLSRLLDSYNLPADHGFVRGLLKDSAASFSGRALPVERKRFLFVAEDIQRQNVVGCSLIIARHGTKKLPHIAFRVERGHKPGRTLKLVVNRSGYTEIGGLALLPAYRRRPERIATQLSYVRFAFMAWNPSRFCPRVLVEYFPKLDRSGGNSFWRVLGARFTGLSYREADRLSISSKEFILSLFPKEKIDCGLLPKSAVRDVGIPGPGAQASLHMLGKIGFRYMNQVDPFDGGPHYSVLLRKISVVQQTSFFRLSPHIIPSPAKRGEERRGVYRRRGKQALIMSIKAGFVRAAISGFVTKGNAIRLLASVTRALALKPGDRVSVTPMGR